MFVVNDPDNAEASYIKIVDEDENALAYFHGPMSFFAAGAFIHMSKAKSQDCQYIATQHWRE